MDEPTEFDESLEFDWRPHVPSLIPRALRLATRLLQDPQLAEDAVQEALVKLARFGTGFSGESQMSTYFERIVINACNDQRSRRQRCKERPLITDLIPGPTTLQPEFVSQQAEQIQKIRCAVETLPSRQRDVLILSVWEKRTPIEIGQMLGMKIQNVYAALSAARQQLRERLNQSERIS